MTKRFAAMGGHHSPKARTVEWLTPPTLLAALGPFDLDPCATTCMPWRTATRMLSKIDNGLSSRWDPRERAFVNPPYTDGEVVKWLARLAEHGHGTALIFARTETDAFFEQAWKRASALLFMRGRINFHFGEPWVDPKTGRRFEIGERAPGNAGAPTVLCAYGTHDADVLATCSVDGQFVPLRFPRSVLVSLIDERSSATWRQALADLYAAFATHPKATTNPNFDAKLRQQLQAGPYRRVGPALWERENVT